MAPQAPYMISINTLDYINVYKNLKKEYRNILFRSFKYLTTRNGKESFFIPKLLENMNTYEKKFRRRANWNKTRALLITIALHVIVFYLLFAGDDISWSDLIPDAIENLWADNEVEELP
ncbi:MAG: hypothetical protein AAFO07_19295 [Bacteroidota bacterium]